MKCEKSIIKIGQDHGSSGLVLAMAYIGAVVYFFHQSPDFWGFILAVVKAMAWPAFVVYKLMIMLGV